MVVPSLDFYWPPVVAGARAAAAALGVSIQLRGSSYDPDEDRRQVSKLVAAGEVQGLLLAPSLAADGALPEWIGRLAVPAVLLEREPHGCTSAEWVRTDHAHGLDLAVRHLRQQGHRRVGLVLARDSPTSAHLLRAWRAGHTGMAELVTPGQRGQVHAILRECRRDGTTALVVHSDPEAVSLVQCCADRDLAVPGDFAIVSYDDEVAHLAEPALTAVRPPKSHLGRLAVELMVARLAGGGQRPAHRVLLAPDLVVRASSVRL
jgi:DNA-binding LacI/PurR family transcriptional regulator